MKFARIAVRPEVCIGKPCVRDLRFPVSRLLSLLAAGLSREQILTRYPYLESPDIDEALHHAACLAEEEDRQLAQAAGKLSEKAFEDTWDNSDDASYDDS